MEEVGESFLEPFRKMDLIGLFGGELDLDADLECAFCDIGGSGSGPCGGAVFGGSWSDSFEADFAFWMHSSFAMLVFRVPTT
jgi:hypothetical protein